MPRELYVTRPSLPQMSEYIEEIRDIWDTHILTNMGCKHKQLEEKLKHYLDANNLTLFTNGHLALEAAIAALGVSGQVITTPFTFVSTTHAIVRNGLTPVFCDINQDDFTIDVDQIESLITSNTSAILPVHVYGNICEIHSIQRIADKYGLNVIYDAAHAFGVTVDGVGIANFGDASMFSFHATKVFNTIEGGAVAFKDARISDRLDSLKNFGITGPDSIDFIGGNAKMNEFQAAMGLCNLRTVDEDIEKRRIVVERYREHLQNKSGLSTPEIRLGFRHNYAYFPVIFDGFRLSRDQVYEALAREGIYARRYFYPTINNLSCYRDRYPQGRTPVAEYFADRVLTLPLYADLALEDVDRICGIILR